MNFFVKLQKIQQKDKIFSQSYFQNILQYPLNMFRRKNNVKKCEFVFKENKQIFKLSIFMYFLFYKKYIYNNKKLLNIPKSEKNYPNFKFDPKFDFTT